MKPFSQLVLEIRAKNGLSMKDFAKICNVSIQTIYNIENELATPTRTTKAKIMLVINELEKKETL